MAIYNSKMVSEFSSDQLSGVTDQGPSSTSDLDLLLTKAASVVILTVGQHGIEILNHRPVFLRLLGLQQFNVHQLPANCRKVVDIWCREERPERFKFVERKQELLGVFVQMGADFRNELLSR